MLGPDDAPIAAGASAAHWKNGPWRLTVAIRWNPSRGATLGIEWELQLIDCRSRMLRQDAREVLAALPALAATQRPLQARQFNQDADPGDQDQVGHATAPPLANFTAELSRGHGFAG